MGSFKPNPFGLYDTAGNVWEWVEDCWHEDYKGAPTDGRAWLKESGGQCDYRVSRGGSWNFAPRYLRSSDRWFAPDFSLNCFGFRLVQDID